jgi:hypothetical protein
MSAYDWEPILDEHERHVAWAATNPETGVTFQVSPDGDDARGLGSQRAGVGRRAPASPPRSPSPSRSFTCRSGRTGRRTRRSAWAASSRNAEMEPALTRWNEARLNGEILDPHDVFRACERDGESRTLNVNSREDRVEFMVRRIADEEALARGDQLGEPPAPRQDGATTLTAARTA